MAPMTSRSWLCQPAMRLRIRASPQAGFICPIDRAGNPRGAAPADPAFHGHEQRDVHGNRIGPADNQLGHMFGHGHAAAGQNGDLVPNPDIDQVQMDLFHAVLDEKRLRSLFPAEFIGREMEDLQPVLGQFEGPLRPRRRSGAAERPPGDPL